MLKSRPEIMRRRVRAEIENGRERETKIDAPASSVEDGESVAVATSDGAVQDADPIEQIETVNRALRQCLDEIEMLQYGGVHTDAAETETVIAALRQKAEGIKTERDTILRAAFPTEEASRLIELYDRHMTVMPPPESAFDVSVRGATGDIEKQSSPSRIDTKDFFDELDALERKYRELRREADERARQRFIALQQTIIPYEESLEQGELGKLVAEIEAMTQENLLRKFAPSPFRNSDFFRRRNDLYEAQRAVIEFRESARGIAHDFLKELDQIDNQFNQDLSALKTRRTFGATLTDLISDPFLGGSSGKMQLEAHKEIGRLKGGIFADPNDPQGYRAGKFFAKTNLAIRRLTEAQRSVVA